MAEYNNRNTRGFKFFPDSHSADSQSSQSDVSIDFIYGEVVTRIDDNLGKVSRLNTFRKNENVSLGVLVLTQLAKSIKSEIESPNSKPVEDNEFSPKSSITPR